MSAPEPSRGMGVRQKYTMMRTRDYAPGGQYQVKLTDEAFEQARRLITVKRKEEPHLKVQRINYYYFL